MYYGPSAYRVLSGIEGIPSTLRQVGFASE